MESSTSALLSRLQTLEATVESEGQAILTTLSARDQAIANDMLGVKQSIEQVRGNVDATASKAVQEFASIGNEIARIKSDFEGLHASTVKFIEHSTALTLRQPQESDFRKVEGKIRLLEDVSKELALYQAMQQQKEPETVWFRQFMADVTNQQQKYIDLRVNELMQRLSGTQSEIVRIEDMLQQGLIAAENQVCDHKLNVLM